ncbi:MAG: hypothetical protein KDD47_04050, partial [Acidobacteria bacterium]|nr:hypothetical protein [Acidobacteriota bacterium]
RYGSETTSIPRVTFPKHQKISELRRGAEFWLWKILPSGPEAEVRRNLRRYFKMLETSDFRLVHKDLFKACKRR